MTRTRACRLRPGAALVEFALAIPLLVGVLGLTFFFGWAMKNQHQVWAADRYACWRQVRTGQTPPDWQINQMYFANKAINMSTNRDAGDTQTEQDFAADVSASDGAAGELATQLAVRQFPGGLSVHVQGEFPTSVGLWQQYTGAIRSRHARQGVEWRRQQAGCESAVADQQLTSVDGALMATPAPADGLARFLRTLYLQRW